MPIVTGLIWTILIIVLSMMKQGEFMSMAICRNCQGRKPRICWTWYSFKDTLELTSPSPKDFRWKYRFEAWNKASRYKELYLKGAIAEDDVIDYAHCNGQWSIWFTVFKGIDSIRHRLITDFPGTCAHCFDENNHYEPVERNPGCPDPVWQHRNSQSLTVYEIQKDVINPKQHDGNNKQALDQHRWPHGCRVRQNRYPATWSIP